MHFTIFSVHIVQWLKSSKIAGASKINFRIEDDAKHFCGWAGHTVLHCELVRAE